MLYNNGIVIAKHIFFYHVYGAENLNSLQIPLDDALYLKHILFQEIHALFHKFIKQGFREDIYVISSCGKRRRIITDDREKKILRNAE